MIFGYARVSTKKQSLKRQEDSLKLAGCEKIYKEKVSGRSAKKKKLDELLTQLRENDVLIVDSLDRLGRTSKELINLLNELKEMKVSFRSLKEGAFDTTTAMGKAMLEIVAILKAMEVEVLRERTVDGLNAARARGVKGGRPAGTYDKKKADAVVALYNNQTPISVIEEMVSVSRATIYKHLRRKGIIE